MKNLPYQKTSKYLLTLGIACLIILPNTKAQKLVGDVYQSYFGANYLLDLDTSQDNFSTSIGSSDNFSKSKTDKASTVMLRWGYRENNAYGIELGYLNMLNSKSTADNGLEYEHNARGFFADLLIFFPINNKATIYGKVGTAKLKIEGKAKTATNTISKTNEKWSPSYGIGMEYAIASQFAIRAGWESIEIESDLGGKSKHGGINIGGFVFY